MLRLPFFAARFCQSGTLDSVTFSPEGTRVKVNLGKVGMTSRNSRLQTTDSLTSVLVFYKCPQEIWGLPIITLLDLLSA